MTWFCRIEYHQCHSPNVIRFRYTDLIRYYIKWKKKVIKTKKESRDQSESWRKEVVAIRDSRLANLFLFFISNWPLFDYQHLNGRSSFFLLLTFSRLKLICILHVDHDCSYLHPFPIGLTRSLDFRVFDHSKYHVMYICVQFCQSDDLYLSFCVLIRLSCSLVSCMKLYFQKERTNFSTFVVR